MFVWNVHQEKCDPWKSRQKQQSRSPLRTKAEESFSKRRREKEKNKNARRETLKKVCFVCSLFTSCLLSILLFRMRMYYWKDQGLPGLLNWALGCTQESRRQSRNSFPDGGEQNYQLYIKTEMATLRYAIKKIHQPRGVGHAKVSFSIASQWRGVDGVQSIKI